MGVKDDHLGVKNYHMGVKDEHMGVKDDDLGVKQSSFDTRQKRKLYDLGRSGLTMLGGKQEDKKNKEE